MSHLAVLTKSDQLGSEGLCTQATYGSVKLWLRALCRAGLITQPVQHLWLPHDVVHDEEIGWNASASTCSSPSEIAIRGLCCVKSFCCQRSCACQHPIYTQLTQDSEDGTSAGRLVEGVAGHGLCAA